MPRAQPRPWARRKGNRVSTVSDELTIPIGGERDDDDATATTAKKKKKTGPRPANNRIKSTKYTVITFLPQNLLEQFRRIANFYFLVMVIISTVIDSPVSPLTSLVPLVFVISVTAAKQGYEDFLRFRADNMVNYSNVTVIRAGHQMDVRSQDVLQGDLVKAARDCDVPCDLVLLMSSDGAGKVHVTTANLDGETNLKTLSVPRGLPECGIDDLHELGTIHCEQPRTDLYTFVGRIESRDQQKRRDSAALTIVTGANDSVPLPAVPLMADNLLLRGSRIKNTEWAIGCAVYTGQNTKLSLNSRLTRNKMSSSESFVNKFLVFFLLMLIAMVTVSYFLKRYFDLHATEHNQYLGEPPSRYQIASFLQDFFSFLILFNYLIPISLYVTIEFHKFFGSFFMEWDGELYDADTNQPFIVNTSDLNEELGQIKYLFSDKTGTLTKNEMILQQCSIRGRMYTMTESGIQEKHRINPIKIGEFREEQMAFFQTLATCHTVQVTGDAEGEAAEATGGEAGAENSNGTSGEELLLGVSECDGLETREMATGDSQADVSLRNGGSFGQIAEEVDGQVKGQLEAATSVTGLQRDHNGSTDETDFRARLQLLIPTEYLDDEPLATVPKRPAFALRTPSVRRHRPFSTAMITTTTSTQDLTAAAVPPSYNSPPPVRSRAAKLQRPLSTIYPQTEPKLMEAPTHRRTQSYVTPTSYSRQVQTDEQRQQQHRPRVSSTSTQRQSVANLREFYAAPAFNRSTLVERTDSIRRRNELKSTVQKLDYQASSPDEKALVEGCAKVGFLYTGEIGDTLTVRVQPFRSAYTGKVTNLAQDNNNDDGALLFDRLATLEFTSDRKRMSTVLRDRRDGQLWLLTKGAESHVLPLCSAATEQSLMETTLRHINEFAGIGLRTLAVARRRMTMEEYERYVEELRVAASVMTADRMERIDEVNARLEQNLQLLGATAVEDALQDNVRDTLESLRFAGIKVWVLTGDKVETALNIALSCGHIPEQSERFFITECRSLEHLSRQLDVLEYAMNSQPDDIFSLLIDGTSLAVALKDGRERFRDISMKCRAVLCCRLSPLQKCEVVQLIKSSKGRPITGAIGDGANDVSMIQEAHVGLGIVGKEGRQAARCADYAFANFSMLKRVLLVHGYYYSQRLSGLVLYFFYKNLVFMMIQFYFQINSMFSTESVYDSLFLTLYNVFYTSVPVLLLSLTEKLYTEQRLLDNPPLYTENECNKRFYWKYFIGWMSLGLYHSAVIYVASYIVWSTNAAILPEPFTVNFYCFGTFLMHNVVVLVNLKLWLVAKYQSNWFILSVVGSIVLFVLSTLVYNLFLPKYDGDMLWVYITLLGSPTVWLMFLWIAVAALLPDYAIKSCHEAFGLRIHSIFPGAALSAEKHRARKLFSYRRRRPASDLESTNL